MTSEYKKFHSFSSPYYPRANGQAESTNKILVTILYKTCGIERGDWEGRLSTVLWAYRTTYKATTGQTPFYLMYEREVVILVEYTAPSFKIAMAHRLGDEESLRERFNTLMKLDERRTMAQ